MIPIDFYIDDKLNKIGTSRWVSGMIWKVRIMNYNIEKLFYYNENLTFIHEEFEQKLPYYWQYIYKVEIHVEF